MKSINICEIYDLINKIGFLIFFEEVKISVYVKGNLFLFTDMILSIVFFNLLLLLDSFCFVVAEI